MKTRPVLLAAGSLLACCAGYAQPIVATRSTSDEPVVELSPFRVDESRDVGYQALSTLAGTRLNTPMKDLGASISVYTKDFLNDIGATNTSDLLIYGTGTEAAGPGGNFSGAISDTNALIVLNGGMQNAPQGASRSRGLAAPTFTRGLFPSAIDMDAYNTDAVTVNRGANAILFGVGSPAGVVDTSLLQAGTTRDRNSVVARYGDNGSVRTSLDLNRVLIPQKLGFRVAALRDRNEYDQRPAFEEKHRIYGAAAYKPSRSTSLRASFESGNTRANRPITILPYNSVSSFWYAAGRPSFDWSFYDDPARNPSAASQNAASFISPLLAANLMAQPQLLVGYTNPGDTTPSFAFINQLNNTTGTAANLIRNQLLNPLVNRDAAADTIQFLSTRNLTEIAGSFWTAANMPPGNLPGVVPAGIKAQGLTNYQAFDFGSQQIYQSGRQGDSFHTLDLALEQRAWRDRVGVELAYHSERVDRRDHRDFMFGSTTSHIRIDTNVTLPNGQPNPNLGRPYMLSGQQGYSESFTERESIRATAFLRYDFKESRSPWMRWLGRHVLTGLYEQDATDGISNNFRLATDGAAAQSLSTDVSSIARRPLVIAYLGPSIIGNNNPLQLQPVKTPILEAGPIATPASYFSRAANDTDAGAFATAPASLVELNNGGTLQRDIIKSQALALQSYWLKEYLITAVGWRRDEDYFANRTVNFVATPSNPNDPGKVHYTFADLSFPRTPPLAAAKEITSWSAVLRLPTALIRLPRDVDFRLFYNRSANFTPKGGSIDPFGRPLPSPEGETKEFGFNLSAFGDKLTIRFNTFETNQKYVTQQPAVLSTAAYNSVIIVADNWTTEANTNPQLAAQRNTDLQLLLSALPANYLDLYNWKVVGTAPNLTTSHLLTQAGRSDTIDFSAKGLEMDVVCNPTRNWRIMVNVAKQETVQSNVLPFLRSFLNRMAPVWNQLGDRPYANYPQGWVPGNPLTGVLLFRDWLQTNVYVPYMTAIATAGSRSAEQRRWRANLVTSYTFARESPFGRALKGFSIGSGIRWQDKVAIGYPTTRNADQSVTMDIADPFFGSTDTNVDAWIGYGRKLWQNRINWKVKLNATNLIGRTSPIPVTVQPWGDTAFARIAPERRWYLTNTFEF